MENAKKLPAYLKKNSKNFEQALVVLQDAYPDFYIPTGDSVRFENFIAFMYIRSLFHVCRDAKGLVARFNPHPKSSLESFIPWRIFLFSTHLSLVILLTQEMIRAYQKNEIY